MSESIHGNDRPPAPVVLRSWRHPTLPGFDCGSGDHGAAARTRLRNNGPMDRLLGPNFERLRACRTNEALAVTMLRIGWVQVTANNHTHNVELRAGAVDVARDVARIVNREAPIGGLTLEIASDFYADPVIGRWVLSDYPLASFLAGRPVLDRGWRTNYSSRFQTIASQRAA